MHWKLNLHRARRAFVRDYTARTMETMRNKGYDTAAAIAAAQEALVLGLETLALHDTNRDSKRVNDTDWKGLK